MKVYLLDNGYMSCDENHVVAMKTYATNDDLNCPRVWIRLPVYCVLIDHPSGKYIYDLGCDPDTNQFFAGRGNHHKSFPYTCTKEQFLENQLKMCDTEIQDIKGVILSHLHYDHVGNMPLFHGIDVYVNKADYEYALTKGAAGHYYDKYIKEPDVHFVMVENSFTLVDGLDIISIGSSHCPGLLGMLLHLEEENLLFPSDVFYTRDNYGPPFKQSGKMYDSLGFMKVAQEIKKLAEKHHAKIMFSHDMKEFESYKKAPDFYM